MNDGLKASDREAIRGVLAQFGAIQKAVLFGSRATGTHSPASDIDLVLYGDSLTLSDEFRIASSMEDLDLPLRVDLVRYATITPKDLLDHHIRRDGKLFYEAKGCREKAGLDMAGERTVQPLEDCMAALIDYRGKSPQKTSFGIPLITAKVVKGGRIETPDEFIAADDYEPWMRRGIPEAGDVVIPPDKQEKATQTVLEQAEALSELWAAPSV